MIAGRVSVTPRALERVARGVAAQHLGVEASRVAVQLSDTNGLLAVAVSGPLRSAPFTGVDAPGLVSLSDQARANIMRDVTTLGGAQVGTVSLRVTGVDIVETRRVL